MYLVRIITTRYTMGIYNYNPRPCMVMGFTVRTMLKYLLPYCIVTCSTWVMSILYATVNHTTYIIIFILYTDDEQKPYNRPPPYGGYAAMPPDFTTNPDQALEDLDEGLDPQGGSSGGRAEALSPRQYAMLMNSMRDPLTMYSTSLGPTGPPDSRDPLHGARPSAPMPLNQFDPLEGYGGPPYSISPTYGHVGGVADGRGHALEEGGDEMHPMHSMMNSTYQPRPPSSQPRPPGPQPRPPTAPRNPQTQSRH